MRLLSVVALALAFTSTAAAQPKADYTRGEQLSANYFRLQVKDISDHCLTNLTTREDWEQQRPELRRQFLDMMGLWPLPTRTDLRATVTGTLDAEAFTVEKLHFQSMPGLYVTANLYVPKSKPKDGKHPVILYVCGHGNIIEDGVSLGSKTHYQYHPAWFASHGYVCLILDTNELGEIRGDHHGTYSRGMWWWQSRGYTPAGVELWNAMRALDYLESRPDVDAKRIGLTGRSGGGATSWWVAAADDRVQAIVPVAGIADLNAHLCEGDTERLKTGVIAGHCDCMFMVNTYRWDFPMVAALCAPRPLLLGNSDADAIFPVAGYRGLANKVAKVYALYGASDKFQLLETKGPHKDTPELHQGINRWMNRWLKDDAKSVIEDDLKTFFKPAELRVFAKLPEGRLNESIHDVFVKPAAIELPANSEVAKAWWQGRKPELLNELREKVFAGWAKNPPPLKATVAVDTSHDGIRLRAIDFTSEAGVPLRMWVMSSPKVEQPAEVILSVLDEPGWQRWCADLGPDFADALQLNEKPKRDEAKFTQNRAAMEKHKWVYAAIAPRGIGPTRWAEPGSKDDVQIRRRYPLVGQTLEGQRVWDVRRAITALRELPGFAKAPLLLQGENDGAAIALYAALFEPSVNTLDLWYLTPTHASGPAFLNVSKVLDVPQALALAQPRTIVLHVRTQKEEAAWNWPVQLAAATREGKLTIKVVGE